MGADVGCPIRSGFWWLTLLLAVPAAGFLVRLFMIQHDCGHGAFFRHRLANDWIGRVLGVLTLTPYDFWRRTHAIHHATSGNLERRGIGDIDTLTVREYLALSRWGRLRYRLYRHPAVMFGVGPAYLFILQHRLPVGLMRGGWQPWLSTHGDQRSRSRSSPRALIWLIGIGAVPAGASADHAAGGLDRRLAVLRAASVRAHRLGRTTRAGICTRPRCTAARITSCPASCAGSPPISACITCIICAAGFPITGCRACCANIPSSTRIGRLTLWESIKCVRLVLWDESRKKLISFREMRQLSAAQPA